MDEVEFLRDERGLLALYTSPTEGMNTIDDEHSGPGWVRGIVHTEPTKYWFAIPANRRIINTMGEELFVFRARLMAKEHFENELMPPPHSDRPNQGS